MGKDHLSFPELIKCHFDNLWDNWDILLLFFSLVDLNLGIDKIGVIYYNYRCLKILELLELKKNN